MLPIWIIDYFDDDGEDLYFLPSHQVTRKEIATIIRRYEAIKSNA